VADRDATITIRSAIRDDADAIASIYNHYVRTSIATFEEETIGSAEIQKRMDAVAEARLPWFVARLGETVIGYGYATPWRPRSAYRFSVETSIYLDCAYTGRGVGTLLYHSLLPILLGKNVHAVIGGISLPNEASVALHEKFGFRKVAHFSEVGFKFGKWIDVGYWQWSPA
jgi:L-amino acid N-acyltransferase YncA